MSDWKISLDRYLTSGPPEDGYDRWVEECVDAFDFDFYEANDDWIDIYPGQCSEWMDKLFKKGVDPKQAALIIERAHKLYKTQTGDIIFNKN